MKTIKLKNYLDYKFDKALAESWDNVGMQTPIFSDNIKKVTSCLDVTFELIEKCKENGVNFIVSHHPIFLNEKHKENIYNAKLLKLLYKYSIMVYTAHTNLDRQTNGLNWHLMKKLGFSPISNIKDNLGVICEIEPTSMEKMVEKLTSVFGVELAYYKNSDEQITKIAFCSGSAGSLYNECIKKKVDVFITGDVSYHVKLECKELNLNLINIDHSVEKYVVEIFDEVFEDFHLEKISVI